VIPIDVSSLGRDYFSALRSVILTSATLSSGAIPHFLTDRIGIALSKPLLALPSPYHLEKQAIVYIPNDTPPPGPAGYAHLDSLVRFTEEAARRIGGRTLLLVTSNQRLRYAAEKLRNRGIPATNLMTAYTTRRHENRAKSAGMKTIHGRAKRLQALLELVWEKSVRLYP
jgi:Rad3-related DNA helicase